MRLVVVTKLFAYCPTIFFMNEILNFVTRVRTTSSTWGPMETMHAAEPSLTVMPASAGMNAQDFEIYTRPEIRKGCLWDIQLRFNPEFVKKHQISQIYVEKPRGSSETTTYLCLKIRSKLIKPIRELPFTKVAQTVTSEGDVLYFSDFSTVTLKYVFFRFDFSISTSFFLSAFAFCY